MSRQYRVLAGSHWRKVNVSSIGNQESRLTFRYKGKPVSVSGFVPEGDEDYAQAKTTLLVDNYIREEKSRDAIRKTAQRMNEKITFLE